MFFFSFFCGRGFIALRIIALGDREMTAEVTKRDDSSSVAWSYLPILTTVHCMPLDHKCMLLPTDMNAHLTDVYFYRLLQPAKACLAILMCCCGML